jgi:dolichol-phosphate mannosyltransferase
LTFVTTHDPAEKFDRTVIVPTFNEAGNVDLLVKSIREATYELRGATRVLFVDDSPDDKTLAAIESAKADYQTDRFLVEGYRRVGDEIVGGLSGAVIHGMRMCRSEEFVAVMDGDLQHPPKMLAPMFAVAELTDIVVASRYRQGGSAEGLDGPVRHLVSRVSTRFAKVLFPRKLQAVSDPMTGFFIIRRLAFDLNLLKPSGFKILLELMCTHPQSRVVEVPMKFEVRHADTSKGDLKNGLAFLAQLLSLRFLRKAT